MANNTSLFERFKSVGTYRLFQDNTILDDLPAQKYRLIAGQWKTGPVNRAVLINDVDELHEIFGQRDKRLERAGCFAGLLAEQMLASSPILVLNLRSFDDTDVLSRVTLSANSSAEDGSPVDVPFKEVYDTSNFWKAEALNLLNPIGTEPVSLLNFSTLTNRAATIFITPTTLSGYDYSIKSVQERFPSMDVPVVNCDDLVSDYMVDVWFFAENLTDYASLAGSTVYGKYFTVDGIRASVDGMVGPEALSKLAAAGYMGRVTGSLIPDLLDINGNKLSLETAINAVSDTTGIMCKIDPDKVDEFYATNEPDSKFMRSVDLIGSNYITFDEAEGPVFGEGSTRRYLGMARPDVTVNPLKIDCTPAYAEPAITKTQLKDYVSTEFVNVMIPYINGTEKAKTAFIAPVLPISIGDMFIGADGSAVRCTSRAVVAEYRAIPEIGKQGGIPMYDDMGAHKAFPRDAKGNFVYPQGSTYQPDAGTVFTADAEDTQTVYKARSKASQPEVSEYAITIRQTEKLVVDAANTMHCRLFAKTVGLAGIDKAKLVFATITKPDGATLHAKCGDVEIDDNGDISAVEGIVLSADYDTTHDIEITCNKAGDYEFELKCVTFEESTPIASAHKITTCNGIGETVSYGGDLVEYDESGKPLTRPLKYGGTPINITEADLTVEELAEVYNEFGETKMLLQYEFTGALAMKSSGSEGTFTLADGSELQYAMMSSVWQLTKLVDQIKFMKGVYLHGVALRATQFVNGTAARQTEVLSTLVSGGVYRSLMDHTQCQWRYVIDPFKTYIAANQKWEFAKICNYSKRAIAFSSLPTKYDLFRSTDPYFKDSVGDPIEARYCASGGNTDKPYTKLFSFAGQSDGAPFIHYIANVRYNDGIDDMTIPATAILSNAYMRKYTESGRHVFDVVAGDEWPLSGTGVTDIDMIVSQGEGSDMDYLEPAGWNMLARSDQGVITLLTSRSAQVAYTSAFSYIENLELLIYVADNIEPYLKSAQYKRNTANVRLQVKTKADNFMENIVAAGGAVSFTNTCDSSNNDDETIARGFIVLDTEIINAQGIRIGVHRTTLSLSGAATE